jgi:hypothetical protein
LAKADIVCLDDACNVEDRAMAALIVFSIIAAGVAAISVAFWMGADFDRGT